MAGPSWCPRTRMIRKKRGLRKTGYRGMPRNMNGWYCHRIARSMAEKWGSNEVAFHDFCIRNHNKKNHHWQYKFAKLESWKHQALLFVSHELSRMGLHQSGSVVSRVRPTVAPRMWPPWSTSGFVLVQSSHGRTANNNSMISIMSRKSSVAWISIIHHLPRQGALATWVACTLNR